MSSWSVGLAPSSCALSQRRARRRTYSGSASPPVSRSRSSAAVVALIVSSTLPPRKRSASRRATSSRYCDGSALKRRSASRSERSAPTAWSIPSTARAVEIRCSHASSGSPASHIAHFCRTMKRSLTSARTVIRPSSSTWISSPPRRSQVDALAASRSGARLSGATIRFTPRNGQTSSGSVVVSGTVTRTLRSVHMPIPSAKSRRRPADASSPWILTSPTSGQPKAQ